MCNLLFQCLLHLDLSSSNLFHLKESPLPVPHSLLLSRMHRQVHNTSVQLIANLARTSHIDRVTLLNQRENWTHSLKLSGTPIVESYFQQTSNRNRHIHSRCLISVFELLWNNFHNHRHLIESHGWWWRWLWRWSKSKRDPEWESPIVFGLWCSHRVLIKVALWLAKRHHDEKQLPPKTRDRESHSRSW